MVLKEHLEVVDGEVGDLKRDCRGNWWSTGRRQEQDDVQAQSRRKKDSVVASLASIWKLARKHG